MLPGSDPPARARSGMNERLVRTSVFRLAREGWLEATPVGRRSLYRLTRDGARRFEQAYRRIYAAGRAGVGRHLGGRASRDGLTQRRSARRCATSSRGRASGCSRRASTRGRRGRTATRGPASRERWASAEPVLTLRARDDAGARRPDAGRGRACGRGDLADVAADYRRFLQRFGARDRALPRDGPTASTIRSNASSCARC